MYVTRPSEQGAQLAPKLPDSWSRKRRELNSQVSTFWRKGGSGTFLSGHLSWTKIPEQLILTPVEQTSRTKSCPRFNQETLRGSFRGTILSNRGLKERKASSCVSEERPASLPCLTARRRGEEPALPLCLSSPPTTLVSGEGA